MKFCTHCGFQLDDKANFCPKCGTRSVWFETNAQPHVRQQQENPASCAAPVTSGKPMLRRGMIIWACVCLALAVLYARCAIDVGALDMLALPVICLFLAFMFAVLGFSPKEDPYVHWRGKPTRIRKPVFVVLVVFVAFLASGVFIKVFVERLFPLLDRIW